MDRFLRNNTVLRILALVLACMIWIGVNAPPTGGFITGNGTERFSYQVSVELPPDLVLTHSDPQTADVVVNNPLLVSSLSAQMMNVTVIADARSLGPGKHVLRLSASNMPLVSYSLDPTTVTVTLEEKAVVHKDVQVLLNGQPASGYSTGTPVVDTQSVEVSGEKDVVNQVASVSATVPIQGATKVVTKSVNLRALDKDGNIVSGVELNPTTVTVTVPVQTPQSVATVVPQIVGSPAGGYAVAGIVMNPTAVVVNGSPSATANLQTISVPVRVTGLQATRTLTVKIPRHDGVRIQPDTISATVKIEQSAIRSFAGVPIQVENVPSGEQVNLTSTQTVDVTVTGPVSIVNNLTVSQLRVYIDAQVLKPASTTAPVSVSLPDWLKVAAISAGNVPVQVTQS